MLREIHYYQKLIELLICKLPFQQCKIAEGSKVCFLPFFDSSTNSLYSSELFFTTIVAWNPPATTSPSLKMPTWPPPSPHMSPSIPKVLPPPSATEALIFLFRDSNVANIQDDTKHVTL